MPLVVQDLGEDRMPTMWQQGRSGQESGLRTSETGPASQTLTIGGCISLPPRVYRKTISVLSSPRRRSDNRSDNRRTTVRTTVGQPWGNRRT